METVLLRTICVLRRPQEEFVRDTLLSSFWHKFYYTVLFLLSAAHGVKVRQLSSQSVMQNRPLRYSFTHCCVLSCNWSWLLTNTQNNSFYSNIFCTKCAADPELCRPVTTATGCATAAVTAGRPQPIDTPQGTDRFVKLEIVDSEKMITFICNSKFSNFIDSNYQLRFWHTGNFLQDNRSSWLCVAHYLNSGMKKFQTKIPQIKLIGLACVPTWHCCCGFWHMMS